MVETERGKRIAIIIGTNEYLKIEKLEFAESDAKEIGEVLLDQNICGFDEVIELIDRTKEEVSHTIEKVFKDAKKDDEILIYFSGHGKPSYKFDLCLLFKDTDPESLLSTSLKFDYINECKEQSACNRVVVILDCCYSGTAGMKGDFLQESLSKYSGSGTILLTSTGQLGSNIAKEDKELKHGVFTHFLLKGLKDWAADYDSDGIITVDDIYRYTFSETKAKGLQRPQKKGSFEGEMVLGRNPQKIKDIEFEQKKEKLIQYLGSAPSFVLYKSLTALQKMYNNPQALEPFEVKIKPHLESLLNDEIQVDAYVDIVKYQEKLRKKQEEEQKQKEKLEKEKKEKEEQERLRKQRDEELRLQREEEERRKEQEFLEKQRREEQEKKQREEEKARREREEQEKKRIEEAVRKEKEEQERKRIEEEEKAKKEAEEKARREREEKEEQEKLRKEKEEVEKLEESKKKAKEEADKRKREQEEREQEVKRQEELRKHKEETEQKEREEERKLKEKEALENKQREEEQKQKEKLEKEKKEKEEQERLHKQKEKELQRQREEEERKRQEIIEKKQLEEQERKQREEEKARKEEEEKAKREKEEQERKQREEEEKAIWEKEEQERKYREEAERKEIEASKPHAFTPFTKKPEKSTKEPNGSGKSGLPISITVIAILGVSLLVMVLAFALWSDYDVEYIEEYEEPPEESVLHLNPDPSSFKFEVTQGESGSGELYIVNLGSNNLEWEANSDKTWIKLDTPSVTEDTVVFDKGTLDAIIGITIDTYGMEPGTYNGNITVNSNGVNEEITVTLVIREELEAVEMETVYSDLYFDPDPPSFEFEVIEGESDYRDLYIDNLGSVDLEWQASSDKSWIILDSTSGAVPAYETRFMASVDVYTYDMEPGTYNGNITVNSNGGNEKIPVTLVIITPVEEVTEIEAATPVAEDVTITAIDPSISSSQTNAVQKSLFQLIEYSSNSWKNQRYIFVELFGTKYVPLNSAKNKLAELVLDSGEEYAFKTGETLDLGKGYTLEAKQIDVDGEKIWLQLDKDGEFVDDEIISVVEGSTGTWDVELDDIQNEDDVVVLKVHVNQVYQSAVDSAALIDGIWLIDYRDAFTVKSGEEFNGHEIAEISDEYISYK